ncbi:MAG: hypothetical protein EXS00_03840 [Phycisphaerales bacterium]|nr:hypothetical protein [Phycisphaerales bacterium]
MDTLSTIFAVSSPPGVSLRGIVRFAGPAAWRAFVSASKDFGAECPAMPTSPTVRLVRLSLANMSVPSIALLFPAQRSACGQDTVELLLPGNPALLEMVLQGVMELARALPGGDGVLARRADPGEFLARSWLSGRIGLSEAEGIAASISAQSAGQLAAAVSLRDGGLARLAARESEEVGALLALVEVGIDFIDESDASPASPAYVVETATASVARIERVLGSAGTMPIEQALPRVVLRGAPNAGKSALFNAMLGRARTVVSGQPGSTRDAVEESVNLGIEVLLVDTAGVEEGAIGLGQKAQQVGDQAQSTADLVLWCVDASRWGQRPAEIPPNGMLVMTKCDLAGNEQTQSSILHTSAVTGTGLERLRDCIRERVCLMPVIRGGEGLSLAPRHAEALRCAVTALQSAVALAQADLDQRHSRAPELLALRLREALDSIGLIAGRTDPDAILGLVFSRFCIGK